MSSIFLNKNPLRWFFQTARDKGTLRAFKVAWHVILDASWDRFYGTETLKRIPPQHLETDSDNKARATSYGATRARPLMRLLQQLDLPLDGGFVDLGSGKGRVIMIAALHGFRSIVGIDFSAPLCQTARKNWAIFSRRRRIHPEVNIVHTDVTEYTFQSTERTFFLYDPFSSEVLAKVLQNIRQSVLTYPREIWLIYNSPRDHDVIKRCGLFTHSRNFEIGGNEFCVYGNAPIPLR